MNAERPELDVRVVLPVVRFAERTGCNLRLPPTVPAKHIPAELIHAWLNRNR